MTRATDNALLDGARSLAGAQRVRRLSFTLVEMLVAIAAAALVVVGVGQIFASVSGVVSIGRAVTEVNQLARSIERQMRDDFLAFSNMPADETFLAIRMREIGGSDNPIYLTAEDREADAEDRAVGVFPDPYSWDMANERLRGRAGYRRLDEIIFLAFNNEGGGFRTLQAAGPASEQAPPATVARIYYGHALKPAPDPDFPPQNFDMIVETTGVAPTPKRTWLADGDFGQRAGEPNLVWLSHQGALSSGGSAGQVPGIVSREARNEYASEWTLARQPLLLFGGRAAGEAAGRVGLTEALIDNDREYAPYIRDQETFDRFWRNLPPNPPFNGQFLDNPGPNPTPRAKPEPRLIRHGRVDISAQSGDPIRGARRWLEGDPPGTFGEALAFDAGRFTATPDPFGQFDTSFLRQRLWQRLDEAGAGSLNQAILFNRSRIRAAIAGVFARPLQIAEPPVIDRLPNPNVPGAQQAEDALMDTHAVLAARCSNFEVAWTDGTRATDEIDFDQNGVIDVRPGDIIWFDIRRVDPGETSVDRNDRDAERFTWAQAHSYWGPQGSKQRNAVAFRAVYDEWALAGAMGDRRNPNNISNDNPRPGPGLVANSESDQPSQSLMPAQFTLSGGVQIPGAYNPNITGGVPGRAMTNDANEWIFVWPFRIPNGDGAYENAQGVSNAWRKDIMLRVRLTLHDSQGALPRGRDFEFIFDLSPRRQ